jgi:hypothetical protein
MSQSNCDLVLCVELRRLANTPQIARIMAGRTTAPIRPVLWPARSQLMTCSKSVATDRPRCPGWWSRCNQGLAGRREQFGDHACNEPNVRVIAAWQQAAVVGSRPCPCPSSGLSVQAIAADRPDRAHVRGPDAVTPFGHPKRRDLAWRLGLDEPVTEPPQRQAELRNFIELTVKPNCSACGRA